MTRDRKPSKSTCLILNHLIGMTCAKTYGYELMTATGLKSGTLYPILMRLKERGYLASEWGPSETLGRPPRQSYHLTSKGKAYAKRALLDQETSTPSLREVQI